MCPSKRIRVPSSVTEVDHLKEFSLEYKVCRPYISMHIAGVVYLSESLDSLSRNIENCFLWYDRNSVIKLRNRLHKNFKDAILEPLLFGTRSQAHKTATPYVDR